MVTITITATDNGAAVAFPKDQFLLTSFKAAFPRAPWNRGATVWELPGATAVKRAEKWKAEALVSREEANKAAVLDGQAAIAAIKARKLRIPITCYASIIILSTPGPHDALIALLRGAGAHQGWQMGIVPPGRAEAVGCSGPSRSSL